jgi:hypothetical protein
MRRRIFLPGGFGWRNLAAAAAKPAATLNFDVI